MSIGGIRFFTCHGNPRTGEHPPSSRGGDPIYDSVAADGNDAENFSATDGCRGNAPQIAEVLR